MFVLMNKYQMIKKTVKYEVYLMLSVTHKVKCPDSQLIFQIYNGTLLSNDNLGAYQEYT